jgi:hypothetical protein
MNTESNNWNVTSVKEEGEEEEGEEQEGEEQEEDRNHTLERLEPNQTTPELRKRIRNQECLKRRRAINHVKVVQ